MRDWIWIVTILGVSAVVIVKNLPDLGAKHPDEEQVIFKTERNLVTGELRHIEIVRCKYCGQVISYIEFDHYGVPIGGHIRSTHRCGYKWGSHEPYAGLAVGPAQFNFWNWIDSWQRRLSNK